jgi:hypothetical protein
MLQEVIHSTNPNLLALHDVLTDLHFGLKFMGCFIIGEGTFFCNEAENHFVVNVVTYITANQLGIPHHVPYIWSALKEETPLTFNPVNFFLLKCLANLFFILTNRTLP